MQGNISMPLETAPSSNAGGAPSSASHVDNPSDSQVSNTDNALSGIENDKGRCSSGVVHYAELLPNGTFPLDEELNYDRLPDVKAYLMLLGTEDGYRFVWYHRPGADTGDAEDEDALECKRLTDEAVRRGVRALNQSWREGKGVFIDANAPAMDGPIPWLRATGLIEKWYQEAPEAMRPEPQGQEPNYVNCDLWHVSTGKIDLDADSQGNVYMPLYREPHDSTVLDRLSLAYKAEVSENAPWGSKLAEVVRKWQRDRDRNIRDHPEEEYYFDPSSMEFPFFIHLHYGKYHILEHTEDAWDMPGRYQDRGFRPGHRGHYQGRKFDESSWKMPGRFDEWVLQNRNDAIEGPVLRVDNALEYMEEGRSIFGHDVPGFVSDDESEESDDVPA